MKKPEYIGWLGRPITQDLKTADGVPVAIWDFNHQPDQKILSEWATHFRQHYCQDAMLPDLVDGTSYTRASYLTDVKFPDAKTAPGPSTRAGDFGEILLADFAEYVMQYWCPREGRFENRENRSVPSNGCDVLGFKILKPGVVDKNDELLLIECKAGFSTKGVNRLQKAIDDSGKDLTREAMSLNAIKQRLLKTDRAAAALVQRFQNQNDRPFTRISAAAAILDMAVYDSVDFTETRAAAHPNIGNLRLLIIKGTSMMQLVHDLYARAANEA